MTDVVGEQDTTEAAESSGSRELMLELPDGENGEGERMKAMVLTSRALVEHLLKTQLGLDEGVIIDLVSFDLNTPGVSPELRELISEYKKALFNNTTDAIIEMVESG